MSDLSSKWTQATFADLLSATGSAELEDGPKPSASQTGRKICRSGPDRHPVSPSALPGSGSGAMTLDTSPPILSIWSGPAAPECCLASRSQARLCSERLQSRLDQTLAAHLSGLGSTIYAIAWKQHVTPLGRTISRQRASARRTSDNAPSSEPFPKSGWPTAQASDGSGGGQAKRATNPARSNDLMDFAMLAGWPTPMAGTPAQNGNNAAGNNDSSRKTVELVTQICGPARLTASGHLLIGSTAGMPSGGQLNPLMSAWLMGYPLHWTLASLE